MRPSRDQQSLSYPLRLPDEIQADALRLLDTSRELNRSPAFKQEVLVASPPPLPGSRWALPLRYSIPALGLGSRPFRRRPTLTQTPAGAKGGRQLPSTRGLVWDGLLIGRLQDGFPTRPGHPGLTCLEQGGVWIHKACQIRGIEVALGADPTGTPMPAL